MMVSHANHRLLDSVPDFSKEATTYANVYYSTMFGCYSSCVQYKLSYSRYDQLVKAATSSTVAT